ncbi:MAG TPA: flavodoxin domain-containing protein [Microlunatus sp.]|nr:flavodoxin domain-containing protein [Microlunatus sp.]
MAKILITWAGSTELTSDVADLVAAELRDTGHQVTLVPAERARDAWHYDAVIVGSDIRHHHWAREAVSYLRDQAPDLAERPTFLFTAVPYGSDSTSPQNVHRLAFAIGTALPTVFGWEATDDLRRAAIARWAHSITTALSSPVDGLPSGHWLPADSTLAS